MNKIVQDYQGRYIRTPVIVTTNGHSNQQPNMCIRYNKFYAKLLMSMPCMPLSGAKPPPLYCSTGDAAGFPEQLDLGAAQQHVQLTTKPVP